MRHAFGRFFSQATDHVLVSLLWLVGCLPVVTAPISTVALFEVTRLRQAGDDPPLVRSYLAALRQYARTALVIGLGWAALGAVLVIDLLIVTRMAGPTSTVLLVGLLALIILYALGSTALFPVLASFDAPWRHQLRTTALVALVSPGRGLLALLVVGAAVVAVWTVPAVIILVPSLAATALLRLYAPVFRRTSPRPLLPDTNS